ncbi:MAG: 2'-5' RNA ligase family protein [Nanoarchaeota archaeon]
MVKYLVYCVPEEEKFKEIYETQMFGTGSFNQIPSFRAHITAYFIDTDVKGIAKKLGSENPEEQEKNLKHKIEEIVGQTNPFEVSLGRLEYWRPNLVLRANARELTSLHKAIHKTTNRAQLQYAGFKYNPHITLMRDEELPKKEVKRMHNPFDGKSFLVESIYLAQKEPKKDWETIDVFQFFT